MTGPVRAVGCGHNLGTQPPPTHPRLSLDGIKQRPNFRGVIDIVSAHHGPMAAGLAQREAVTAA